MSRRSNNVSVSSIVRGGMWLYVNSVLGSLLGYAYWLVISKIIGSEAVGISSGVISLVSIITTLILFGIPSGMMRFLGIALGKDDISSLEQYFWSGCAFCAINSLVASIIIALLAHKGIAIYGVKGSMLYFASILTLFSVSNAYNSLFVASLKTEYAMFSQTIAKVTRFISGIPLVLLGLGWKGALYGIVFGSLSSFIISTYFSLKILINFGANIRPEVSVTLLKDLITAGIAAWIPNLVGTLGQWLGILSVYSEGGAAVGGYYYIAYMIYTIAVFLPLSLVQLMFPVLSGMRDGRKRALWRVTKLSLALGVIVSAMIVVNSKEILSLMGHEYSHASGALAILSIGLIPTLLVRSTSSLVYAYGLYSYVTLLGMATNIPRIVLYTPLVREMSDLGAALAFFIGSMTGFVASIVIARRVGFKFEWKDITLSLTAYAIFIIFKLIKMPWILSLLISTIVSFIAFSRLGLITKEDLKEVSRAILTEKQIKKLSNRIDFLIRVLYGE